MRDFPLLAQGVPDVLPWWAFLIVGVVVFLFIIAMPILRCYKRCPSNRVLVVYGRVAGGRAAKCIQGGATFVVPFFQDYAYMSLEPIQIEIPLKGALSAENIRVNVPS